MEQAQIRSFAERYLKTMNCQIIESTPEMIDVQLSKEADQALLNRPFYWMYVEQMNLPAKPVQFRFYFTETANSKGFYSDYLFYGSSRFTQMLQSAQKKGRFVRLYQQPQSQSCLAHTTTGYHPILSIQYRISYICDRKRDRLVDLGIDLQTGEIHPSFYRWAKEQQWTHQLPPHRFLHSSQLSFADAVGRCEAFLQRQIEKEDHTWAEQAKERLMEEHRQIDSYYPEDDRISEDQQLEKQRRLRETIWKCWPRVEIDVITAGLFYLDLKPFRTE